MRTRAAAAAIILALVGAGCLPQVSRVPAESAAKGWVEVGDSLARYECPAAECGVRLIMYRFKKGAYAWRFEHRAQPLTVEGWANSLPSAVFVSNGVFFDENWLPTGELVAAGKKIVDKKYDLDKTGYLELAPETRIIDTAAEDIPSDAAEGAQSYPLLVKNGKAVGAWKDSKKAHRTFVGLSRDGDLHFGYLPEDPATFAELAALLAKTPVEWDNVLNLDGGTSTGFAVRSGNYSESMNSIVQVPNVIVAEKK